MPQRIQCRRVKGWRMPAGAVYVGRPTRWGNPFRIGEPGVPDRAAAVTRYRALIAADVELRQAVREHLSAKDLACWCPPGEPCHADVLLEVANHRAARGTMKGGNLRS